MKKLYLASLIFLASQYLRAQGVGINTDGSSPDASAILDVKSSDRGLLVPRMSLTSVTSASPVTSPATGLLVYNTNASVTGGSGTGFYYWDGSQWRRLDPSNSGDWRLTGNAGTSPATNFLGTTDAQDLVFRTNNTERLRILSGGNVGINTSTPANLLHVAGAANSTLARFSVPSGWGQIIVTNGTTTVDMGASASEVFMGANSNHPLLFRTNATERVRITTSGNVGIGTPSPSYQLTLGGTGAVFGVENTATFFARNSSSTYEPYLWPRWSDNVMYLNYGSGGFNIRNNASVLTMFMTNNNRVGIGNSNPDYILDVSDRMRIRSGSSGTSGIWFNNTDNSALLGFAGTRDNDVWGIYGIGINDWHFNFHRQSGNVGIGVYPSATVGHPKLSVSRDGTGPCCGGEDATLAIGDNTQATGRRASISFHNGGEAEGVMRLIQNTINGVSSRRIQLYDNQSAGLGLEIGGSGGVVGRLWYGLSGSRTERRDNAGLQGNAGAQSGFYETDNPSNFPAGASSWWHLLDIRHNNPNNNYAMQFSGSFFDQRFFARKTNNNASQPWSELVTAGRNAFWTMSGNYSHSVDDWCTGCSGVGSLPDLTDDATQVVSLPFNVLINGTNYNQVSICSNGWIAFGSTGAIDLTNTALPANITPLPVIFPYWDDLRDYGSGEWVRWGTVGTSPNRVFIVDYNMRVYGGSDRVNFMVLIHETTNHIVVKYRDAMSPSMNGQSATIGFQLDGGSNAKAYPIVFNGKVLDDNRDDAEGWSVCPIR